MTTRRSRGAPVTVKSKSYRVRLTKGTAKVNGKDVAGEFVTVCELEEKAGDPRSRNSFKRRDSILEIPVAHFYTENGARNWLKEQQIDGRRVTWHLHP